MRIVTGSEMKGLDAWTIEEIGIPSMLLMENAGRAVAQKAIEVYGQRESFNTIILVGKGNNGGDALVAARHLKQLGVDVKLFLLFDPDQFQGDALANWEIVKEAGIKWHLLKDDNSFYLLKLSLNQSQLVIDGIFGTGFKGSPQGNVKRAITTVNESSCPVLAIDVPSGLEADTGKVGEPCIKAKYTVTFAWAKRGLVIYPGKELAGELAVIDISIPSQVLELLDYEQYYVDENIVQGLLPPREREGFKNTFGHVLVIAGSVGMIGAAWLATKAVLRSGAGMVTTCLPSSVAPYFDISLPETITKGLTETPNGTLAFAAWPDIREILQRKKAVVFGPGLTTHPDIYDLLGKVLAHTEEPVVVDADGLNVLAQDVNIIKAKKCPLILTPHPGEMGRLLGITTKEVQENRVEVAREAAKSLDAIVVLKGAATVTASPQGHVYINSTGCPALATAGAGDVLAGIIGGLVAQGIEPLKAAYLGVYIHGLIGDILAEEKGMRGVIASDILEKIPLVLKELEAVKE